MPRLIMAAGGALMLTVAAAFAGMLYWLHERTVREEQVRLGQMALLIAEQSERAFESADGVLRNIVNRIERSGVIDGAVRAGVQDYLSRQMDYLLAARRFLVFDSRGILIIDSESRNPRPISAAGAEYFAVHARGEAVGTYVSRPFVGRLDGRWTFSLGHALQSGEGKFLGVVLASIDLDYFADFFQAIDLGDRSTVTLVRADGINLFRHPRGEAIYGSRFAGSQLMPALAARQTTVTLGVSPAGGERRFIALRPLKGFPVAVSISRPYDEAMAAWRHEAALFGIFGAASVLLVAFGTVVLARQARRQVSLLAEAQTARAAAELASKAAERASRSKSDFLAGVSHDLRTPLNAINGFAELMLNGVAGPLTDKTREYAGFIADSGRHLLGLLNNLLDLAKIEANRMAVVDDEFALAGVAGECLRLVSVQAEAGQVRLAPFDGVKVGLRADAMRLRQILFNLLSNAIKFTPPGGGVELRAALQDDGSLRLTVRDSGIGMRPEDVATALQPYGQVSNTLTREREGTGLGLPLVKALVELHGGRLEIDSAPQRGTSVHVVLPAARVLRRPAARAA